MLKIDWFFATFWIGLLLAVFTFWFVVGQHILHFISKFW